MATTGLGFLLPEWLFVWMSIGALALIAARKFRFAAALAALPLFHWFVVPVMVAVAKG